MEGTTIYFIEYFCVLLPAFLFMRHMRKGIIVCLCIAIVLTACNSSSEKQHKFKSLSVEEYKKLSKDSLNKLLCHHLLHNANENNFEARKILEAGGDPNCICNYSDVHTDLFRWLLRLEPVVSTKQLAAMEVVFGKDSVQFLDYCIKHGGKLDSIEIWKSSSIDMWNYLFTKGYSIKDFRHLRKDVITDKVRLQFLFDKGLDPNTIFEGNYTITQELASAMSEDDTTLLYFLVSNGAKMNFLPKHSDHNFPIFYTLHGNKKQICFFMLRHGADSIVHYKGVGLLHEVVRFSKDDKRYDIVKKLVDLGADANEEIGKFGTTNVYEAIHGDNAKILILLLENGAEFNQHKDYAGLPEESTPFKMAVNDCSVSCLRALIERYPNKVNKKELIKLLKSRMKNRESAASNPKCKECLEQLEK